MPDIVPPTANKIPNIFPNKNGLLTVQLTPKKIMNKHNTVTIPYLINLGVLGSFIRSAINGSILITPLFFGRAEQHTDRKRSYKADERPDIAAEAHYYIGRHH